MPETFGPYRLITLIGRGGMGEVWRARDTRKDRDVAVKVLGAWLGGDVEYAARFRREAALTARLNSPHVIPIHDYGEIDGRLFLEMPLIEGTDLGSILGRTGPMPLERAADVVVQVARALAVAHRAGLVHRDVKPSNILISSNEGADHVYLIDFGIVRAVDGSRLSLTGAVIGTPAYMAPEWFAGDGDTRGDVYALGCVLYEMVTGRKPFPSTNVLVLMNAHLNATPPRPSQTNPGVPSTMDAVVATAMAKDPNARYRGAAELATAVRAATQSHAPHARPTPVKADMPWYRAPTAPAYPAPPDAPRSTPVPPTWIGSTPPPPA